MTTQQTGMNTNGPVSRPHNIAGSRSPRILPALIILTALAGCVHPTPYKAAANDATDGYTTQQIESNRFHISFKGNSQTTRQTVDSYMLYHAAEVTIQNGFDYFVIDNRAVDKDTAYENYGDTLAWGWGGGWGFRRGFGFAEPDTVYSQPINSYDAVADIVLFHGAKPTNQPDAYDAREVLNALGPTIVRQGAPKSS
jgi:hypothetical protein